MKLVLACYQAGPPTSIIMMLVMFIMIKTHRPVINSTRISAVSTNKNPAKEVCSSILTKLIHDVLHLDVDYDDDGDVDDDEDD